MCISNDQLKLKTEKTEKQNKKYDDNRGTYRVCGVPSPLLM